MTEENPELLIRCGWLTQDPIYLAYHDTEWGRPVYEARRLFEMLCLEGMQAGLSWITILKRREAYRQAFAAFDPEKIASFTEKDVEKLMQNAGIIRNRRKIEAIIQNARCYLRLSAEQSFSDFLWGFVGNKPQQHGYEQLSEIPASSEVSRQMSKALKQHGFKFVGETICYAFMQAVGMVNDHLTGCFCYQELKKNGDTLHSV